MVPIAKIIEAFRVPWLLKSNKGHSNLPCVLLDFFRFLFLKYIPTGIRSNPKTKNMGNTMYINSPMYELPISKIKDIISEIIINRKLKVAMPTPIIEVQFCKVFGSFIRLVFSYLCNIAKY